MYDNQGAFPYVNIDSSGFNLGTPSLDISTGFTSMGLIYREALTIYPVYFYFGNSSTNAIRIYSTGSGQVLRARVIGGGVQVDVDVNNTITSTLNSWQVYTFRIKDNGDSTHEIEVYIDNQLQNSSTIATSALSPITGSLEMGNSLHAGNTRTNDANISNTFFYDRELSTTEMDSMHAYLTTLGSVAVTPPQTLAMSPLSTEG